MKKDVNFENFEQFIKDASTFDEYDQTLAKCLCDKIYDSKKISASQVDVANVVIELLEQITHINSLGIYDVVINGFGLDEIQFPDSFKFLIRPQGVRLDPANDSCLDLITKSTPIESFNPNTIRRCIDKIYGYYKLDRPKYSSLSNFMKVQSLNDVLERAYNNTGMMRDYNKFLELPIEVDVVDQLFDSEYNYFNLSYKNQIERFVNYTFVNLLLNRDK